MIYSIGHSARSTQEFIAILKKHKIKVIADIRRFPTSKFEWLRKDGLERSLKEAGIEYVHLEELGGYRHGYEKYMESEEWKKGYKKLKELALSRRAAFMCAEKLPWRCHRRWIARKLKKEGWEVVHLLSDKVWAQK